MSAPDRLPPQPWMADRATLRVLDALRNVGGADAARFVGGCVRNALIGASVDDIDIATPLRPEQVVAALEAADLRAVPTGLAHGTVTAISDRTPFEITTLRRDVETDGRRAVVAFTEDWREDALRRDFRLNALYVEPDGRLHDPTGGGVEDALAGRIVFVGEAEQRIREDYLRILRFFRFRAWYGRGDPDAEALDACGRLRGGMAGLSAERLGKEMLKLLAAPDPLAAVADMASVGVLTQVLPDARADARFAGVVEAGTDPLLRLAALLPLEAAALRKASGRLRLSNAQRDRLLAAVGVELTPGLEAAAYRHGVQAVVDRLRLDRADVPAPLEGWRPPTFPLTGADLLSAGLEAGPAMGEALRRLEGEWIASGFRLDRESLLARL